MIECVIVAAALFAQLAPSPQTPLFTLPPAAGQPGAQGGQPLPQPQAPETVRVVGIQASKQGRAEKQIDPQLQGMATLLNKMPFDTFAPAVDKEEQVSYGEENRIRLNDKYTAIVEPLDKMDNGNIHLRARIVMTEGGQSLNALAAEGEAKPGQALIFRGLNLDGGEMVVVFSIVNDDKGQGQGESDEQQDQTKEAKQDEQKDKGDQEKKEKQEQQAKAGQDKKEQEKKQQDQNDKEDADKKLAQQSEEQPQDDQDKQNAGAPKDKQTIDSILRSLEDQDRQEQREAKNTRKTVGIHGDWW